MLLRFFCGLNSRAIVRIVEMEKIFSKLKQYGCCKIKKLML